LIEIMSDFLLLLIIVSQLPITISVKLKIETGISEKKDTLEYSSVILINTNNDFHLGNFVSYPNYDSIESYIVNEGE